MSGSEKDWNPGAYARFRGLRLRPALDLLAQVGELPEGVVIDLGCGDGAVAPALAARFAERTRVGVDASEAMLARAQDLGLYQTVERADIGNWAPKAPAALIFSNAALHWLPDHVTLLPRLARALVPGGVLAVQMPRQFQAPSHRFLRDIAASMFPERFDYSAYVPPVSPAAVYWQMLAPLGRVQAWESEYIQRLEPCSLGHPVRSFTQSTAMRPIVEKLTAQEEAVFLAAYDAALAGVYPLAEDGSVLFPFRRVFFVLEV